MKMDPVAIRHKFEEDKLHNGHIPTNIGNMVLKWEISYEEAAQLHDKIFPHCVDRVADNYDRFRMHVLEMKNLHRC